MSERKVLQKYIPPDFDPSQITRSHGPKSTGAKVQTVRLMAPSSMKCNSCGEYIYKGRKFNARKETPMNERYLGVQIFRFYIRCTRCSSELVFKTDPQHQDYVCERGATRNFEQWRGNDGREETVDERLDRLQAQEERELQSEEQDSMRTLEAKADNAKREMAIADALDSIRMRNALQERVSISTPAAVDKNEDLNRVNEEAAREAFRSATDRVQKRGHDLENLETWKPSVKKKKDYAGLLVIKRSGK